MLNRSKRMGLAVTAASVVIAVIALVNGRIPGVGPTRWLATYMRGHWDSVPDALVVEEMRQVAAWDQVGPLIVVDALGSSRASVAEAAVTVLHEQLDAWEKRPPEGSSKSVARIAQELAQHVDRWPAGMQCAAADLALRILDWPADSRQVQRAPLIANCEYVLRTQQGSPTSIAPGGPRDERAEVENAARPDTAREVRSPAQRHWDLSPTAGGDLPVAEVELPALSSSPIPSVEPRRRESGEPELLPPAGARSSGVASPGSPQLSDGAQMAPALPPALRTWTPPADEPASAVAPADTSVESPSDQLATWSDLDLIRSLDEQEPALSRRATTVLRTRGFRKFELALAYQLASPDIATRRQLVETVGRLPAGAGRWLIWLSQDPDPGVRQATVSWMVTAQDPHVRRRLLAMENAEVDEDVREQLRRWREMEQ